MEEKLNSHSPQWLSIVEYARAFGVSDMTVRRKIKTGKLNHEMRGNKYYIRVDQPTNNVVAPAIPVVSPKVEAPIQSPVVNEQNEIPQSTLIKKQSVQNPLQAQKQKLVHAEKKINAQSESDRESQVRIEAENLLKLCNTIISEGKKKESLMQSKFDAETRVLESQLRAKHTEIGSLKRKLEDMQLLIKMLESKG